MATTQLRKERLEARITSQEKNLLEEAARRRGVSLAHFVVTSAHEAALRTLEQQQVIELGSRDQRMFVDALLNPEPPNARLRAAAERHEYAKR